LPGVLGRLPVLAGLFRLAVLGRLAVLSRLTVLAGLLLLRVLRVLPGLPELRGRPELGCLRTELLPVAGGRGRVLLRIRGVSRGLVLLRVRRGRPGALLGRRLLRPGCRHGRVRGMIAIVAGRLPRLVRV